MLITLALVLLMAIPKRSLLASDMLPAFPLIAAYYWGLFREQLMPYWFLFVLGLLQDALMGLPLGASSLVFLMFRMLVVTQKRLIARETFWGLWVGFLLMSLIAFAGYWLVLSLYHDAWLPLRASMMQWLLTAASYPLIHVLFTRLYRLLPKEKQGL